MSTDEHEPAVYGAMATTAALNIEADDDIDSALGNDDAGSETQTLTTSIFDFRYENGRRYHAFRDAEYWCPNDEGAQEQLDIGHYIYLMLLNNKLFLAPIGPTPQKVLDNGTGTGIWAIDFADQYPTANVTGTDLSPIQPSYVPPNVQFEIDDAASEWTFPKESFDFIHVRGMFGSLRDWPRFYQQVLDHLKPGGYYEQFECSVYCHAEDATTPPGSPLRRWGELFTLAGEKMGKPVDVLDRQYEWLKEAGFVDVCEQRFKMPDGDWPKDPRLKEIGKWRLVEVTTGAEGWALALMTRVLGMSVEEVQVLLAEMRRDWKDRRIHGYTRVGVVYGRKPGGWKSEEW